VAIARSARRKEDRLELRLEAERRLLLDRAAQTLGMSTSAFVLEHATEAAQRALADQTRIVLPAEHWDAFVELLGRDEQPVEGLAALLAGPSVQDLE
jgi:uncharacterized protein (DUF1778 family)